MTESLFSLDAARWPLVMGMSRSDCVPRSRLDLFYVIYRLKIFRFMVDGEFEYSVIIVKTAAFILLEKL